MTGSLIVSERRNMFTTDGVKITNGLRVFTNNLDRGVVSGVNERSHNPEWFDVILDTDYKGNPTEGSVMQNAERVATHYRGEKA